MDAISEFVLFRTIVEEGGISAAARRLESSPAALETKLGVRLAG
ncbi:LysR family transcriptional regulator [Rhizobium sp. NPDC090279]